MFKLGFKNRKNNQTIQRATKRHHTVKVYTGVLCWYSTFQENVSGHHLRKVSYFKR